MSALELVNAILPLAFSNIVFARLDWHRGDSWLLSSFPFLIVWRLLLSQ